MPHNFAIILRIRQGNFATGFPLEIQVLDNSQVKQPGTFQLPPAPDLPELYQTWQQSYQALGQQTRVINPVPAQITQYASLSACRDLTDRLESAVSHWFNHPTFATLSDRIRVNAIPTTFPLVIDAQTGDRHQDILLRKLPWHLWELLDRHIQHAELTLMSPLVPPAPTSLQRPLRVLAIFGSSEGDLQLDHDRQILSQISPTDATITIESQPSRATLNQRLFHETWDILFFAGHSFSTSGCKNGYLQIQDGDNGLLSLKDLREDLKKAIRQGLKLAIFNSCDGLGLADYLANLEVPSTIVMREPVPDIVARNFLAYFLHEFLTGKSLYTAVHEARQALHWMESSNPPCLAASWLPIIQQNPSLAPFSLPSFDLVDPTFSQESKKSSSKKPFSNPKLILFSLISLFTIAGITTYFTHTPPHPIASPQPSLPIYDRFSDVPNSANFKIRFGGSTSWSNMSDDMQNAIKKEKGWDFEYIPAASSGAGIRQIISGDIDVAHIARSISDLAHQQANINKVSLKAYCVAADNRAFLVSKNFPVSALSLSDLQQIYDNPSYKTWKQAAPTLSNQTDFPVQIVDRTTANEELIQLTPFDTSLRFDRKADLKTPTEEIDYISKNMGAITIQAVGNALNQSTIKTLALVNPTTQQPILPYTLDPTGKKIPNKQAFRSGDYPLANYHLYVLVNQDNGIKQRKGETYVDLIRSKQGQAIVEASGFMSLTPDELATNCNTP
jgi:ABC-type phosphate transport system substrate-binding protein